MPSKEGETFFDQRRSPRNKLHLLRISLALMLFLAYAMTALFGIGGGGKDGGKGEGGKGEGGKADGGKAPSP